MISNQLCKIACLSLAAIFCVSGQSPRKEIRVIPATEQISRQAEVKKEVSNSEKIVDSNRRKSAAQRSMEAESQAAAEDPRGAAQKSIDLERSRANLTK